jgi:branched-chain amino acid transport system substrate-binding protein
MRAAARFVAACLMVLVLGALSERRAFSAEQAPYEIQAILSLTGPGTFLGTSYQNSLKALEAIVNRDGGLRGRPIHFVVLDDQSSPQIALQAANAIVAKDVPVLLGPVLTATCRAIEPLVRNGPVQYCLSPSIYPAKNSYVFSAGVSNRDFIGVVVRYFRERGLRRFGLLVTTDSSGQAADEDFAATLALAENRDMTIVDEEHFSPADQTVSAQLAKIKASSPQAVVVWASGTPFGTALRGIQDAGFDVPVATSSANMSLAQMKQYAAFLPRELYFTGAGYLGNVAASAGERRAQSVYSAAMKANNIGSDLLSGFAWDPGAIVVDALRHLGANATSAQIRDYIEGLHGYAGISGTYDFRDGSQRGLKQNAITVYRWDQAGLKWIGVSKFSGMPL